jgi:hypothetical protein
MYSQLLSENESAFGQLFKGPWLTSETFDIAKEWGITPRIQDIIKDLDMQIKQFADRRNMIDKLFKRGIPKGFLDELRTMSPEEAMPLLKELVDATPKETARLINKLNTRERDIKAATMIDFTREINQFKKAGGDMGQGIINGFQNAGVGKWFDAWIKTTFPGVINAAIAQGIKEFKVNNPAAATAKPGAKPPIYTKPTSRRNTSTHTDNSKKITVHMIGSGGPHHPDAASQAEKRKQAFILATKLKSLLA